MITTLDDWVSQRIHQKNMLDEANRLKLLISDSIKIKNLEKIFLQGSRGFFTKDFPPTPAPDLTESDWDFAIESDSERLLAQRFVDAGWELCDTYSYKDNDTTWVYNKEFYGHKVQVSLRNNLTRFIDCFNSIETSFYFKYMHKSSNKCMDREDMTRYWNSLYYAWDCGNGWTR